MVKIGQINHPHLPFTAPWRHVYMVAGFGYLGYYWSSWETQLLTSINKTRKERGMIEIKRQELNIAMPKVFKKEEEEPQE
jgi:hypothetical protein